MERNADNVNMADTAVNAPPSQSSYHGHATHIQHHHPVSMPPPPPPLPQGPLPQMSMSHHNPGIIRSQVPYSVPSAHVNTPIPQPAPSSNNCMSPVHTDVHQGSLQQTSQSHEALSPQSQPVTSSTCDTSPNNIQSPQHPLPESTTTTPTDRNHICPSCSKGFKSKQQLAQHSLVHSGIRKYICSYCEKAFKQLCHLQQHTRIHTGEKPYKCSFEGCERAFAQMANLHHHLRNHDDHMKKAATKQYQCLICHRAYTNESSLKSHTLKMHVHVKPLEHRVSGLPAKPRKRQQKTKDSSSQVMAIDLTGDDERFETKPDIFNRADMLSKGDNSSVIRGENNSMVRSDNYHQRSSEELARDIHRDLQRDLQRLGALDSSQLRFDPTQLRLEHQSNLGLLTGTSSAQNLLSVPRAMSSNVERLTDTPSSSNNKGLTSSDILHAHSNSESSRSDSLQNNGPSHANMMDPMSYYRSSPYDLPPHISHAHQGLHIPMRIPSSLPPFSQMGGGRETPSSSHISSFSSLQGMMVSPSQQNQSQTPLSLSPPSVTSPQHSLST